MCGASCWESVFLVLARQFYSVAATPAVSRCRFVYWIAKISHPGNALLVRIVRKRVSFSTTAPTADNSFQF